MADLSSLLQLSQQMQGRLTEIQTQLAQQTLTVSAGGGMVQATVDGRGHIRAIKIDPQAVSQGDVEMLEDLVLAAVVEAQKRAAELYQAEVLKQPAEIAERLAEAIRRVRGRVVACATCGNLADEDPCPICRDPRRDAALLCVVEESGDVSAIERAGRYRGRYHVLGGRISPLDGIGPDELHFERLVARLTNGSEVREVIVATNPSMEGEATATYLQQLLKPIGVRVTRIARGLPVGGDLEYADAVTIAQALAARREMSKTD